MIAGASSAPPKHPELSDPLLIGHVLSVADDLGFLTEPTMRQLTALGGVTALDLGTCEKIDQLWRDLIVDSIHALKVRDRREKACIRKWDPHAPDNGRVRNQNTFGITELMDYFRGFVEYESALYASETHYRDHVTHALRVWLIGAYILTHDSKVDDLDIGFTRVSPTERWAMWTLVSLCHDLGYPLEKTHKLNDAMNSMLAHFGNISTSQYHYAFQAQHHRLIETALDVISSKAVGLGNGKFTTRIQAKYLSKFAHSLEEFQHGVVSVLVLLKTLVYFLETDYDHSQSGLKREDARQFHIRREILRAIASHTCTDIYHLEMNNLSFLLILADELQEWGRPAFRQLKLGRVGGLQAGVTINANDLKKGVFEATVRYEPGAIDEKDVRRRFCEFGKLMRAAIEDNNRRISFKWTVLSDRKYVFVYDSNKEPFQELTYLIDGKTTDLYAESDEG
ncbi:MAG: hypothetical protein Q8P31_03855 [Bacillota bacterium]|nr:hypothetical protein [Bacillota bacterium]